jgi:D-alanyl-D-alanine carboxypeptidase/D-alanyl-D-alanine-endopeptidase (penicillin-binding protein 4)
MTIGTRTITMTRRRSRSRWVLFVAWTLTLSEVTLAQESAPAKAPDDLSRQLDAVMATPGFQNGHWGLLVVERNTGKTLYERNSGELFAPASVTKLFSTAAALVTLGPGYRFQTPLLRRGEVDVKGTLHGDLILMAQGDLCMGGRTGADSTLVFQDDDHTYAGGNPNSQVVATDPLAGLDHLARETQAAGIREISGDVIVDDRLFSPAPTTGSGPRSMSPIIINDNVIDILTEPAQKAGESARVTFRPASQFVTIDAQVATTETGREPEITVRLVGPRRYAVRGRVPVGHARVVKIGEIEDPASFARTLLIEALRRHGVHVGASSLSQNSGAGLPPRAEVPKLPKVAEYTSPPFSEYARVILKVSHNLYASTLPLLLAVRHGERTLEAGLRRQGEVLRSLGVEAGTVSFGGGAGGSPADLVTPQATVGLLRAMAARPEFAVFDAALPVLGRDGTLAKAVAVDNPARGHAHAKTGTYFVENQLDGTTVLTSKALAGYLETASGRSLVFAAFVNNVPIDGPRPNRSVADATGQAGRLLGKLCEVLYLDNGKTGKSAASAGTKAGVQRTAKGS